MRLPVENRSLTEHPGEGRAPKRVQREVSNEMIPARPAEPTPSAGMRPDPFPTPAARRRQSSFRDQTFRDQRALPNSTSLQSSPSKRYEKKSHILCLRFQLTFPDLRTTASPSKTHHSDHLRLMLRKTLTLGKPPLAALGLALPPEPLLANARPRNRRSISCLLSTSTIVTQALDPLNLISIPFRNRGALHMAWVGLRMAQ